MEKHEGCETHVGGDWMSEEEIDYNLMGTFPGERSSVMDARREAAQDFLRRI